MSNAIFPRTIGPATRYADAAHAILRGHLATLDIWAAFLTQADRPHEHHEMRIAAKRLRYSLDLFRPLLTAVTDATLPALKVTQSELGALHDLDELFFLIEDTIMTTPAVPGKKRHEVLRARLARQRASLEELLSAVAAQRDAQHARCLALWRDLEARDAFAPLRAWLADAPVGDGETPSPGKTEVNR